MTAHNVHLNVRTPIANERPILFSAPMVRALLDVTKTQTRRVTKGHAALWLTHFEPDYVALPGNHLSPYGYAGDLLWVRETFYAWGRWETRYSATKGRDEWHFIDMTLEFGRAYLYAADQTTDQPALGKRSGGAVPAWWKRPAIFMPRWASRLTLEVTQVRVERLQDISEADCVAEGMSPQQPDDEDARHKYSARWAYEILWEQINGPGTWAANPWVWAVSFRRIPLEGGSYAVSPRGGTR